MKGRIVLAYSGGLAGSVAIPWLVRQRGAEIITVTLDFGEGRELDDLRARALGLGAVRAHVLDVREEFARDYVLPAVQAGALGDGGRDALKSLATPLIAKKVAEIAAIEKAALVVDFARESGMTRDAQQEYARAHGITIARAPVTRGARPAALTPGTAAHVEISFETGMPTAINGIPMRMTELLESLTTIAGEHGIGSLDDFYMPAALVLRAAYAEAGAARLSGTVRLKLSNGTCELEGATLAQA